MTVRSRVTYWKGDEVKGRIKQAVVRGLVKAGDAFHDYVVDSMANRGKSGKTYRHKFYTEGFGEDRDIFAYGTRPPLKASRAGQPPAVDEGNLVGSGDIIVNKSELSVTVSFTDDAAVMMEYGTDMIMPRPFMRPAVRVVGPTARKLVRDEVKAELAKKVAKKRTTRKR